MSHQECALYGELVLWLRDRAAELQAGDRGDAALKVEREKLDEKIREWFFAPQERLHGSAPRGIIWAEQLGEPNPMPPDAIDDMFEDDCPVCTFEKERIRAAIEAGEDHGFQWYFDDGGYPLIARYDPDGWDERWAAEDLDMEMEPEHEHDAIPAAAPGYRAPATGPRGLDPEAFVEVLKRPWIDPGIQQAAQALVERCDVPVTGPPAGLHYRRLTLTEAISLLAGMDRQGVDVEALLAQIEAWPYQNVALDWFTEPEMHTAMICQAIELEEGPSDSEGPVRMRHHRDFILALARGVSPGARLWLQGWLEAVSQGAFAGPELPF